MNVIAGVPVSEAMLGRPRQWTNVPRLAMGGAAVGSAALIGALAWAAFGIWVHERLIGVRPFG